MPATIVQVPADFALTLPLLTEAIELLVLDQVMLLSVALPGYALALRLALSPHSQRYTAAGNAYTCDRYGFIFVFIMTLTATLVAYIT